MLIPTPLARGAEETHQPSGDVVAIHNRGVAGDWLCGQKVSPHISQDGALSVRNWLIALVELNRLTITQREGITVN